MPASSNPLETAHELASRLTEALAVLFARIGTAEHPRGAVLSAYRATRRQLPAPALMVNEIMTQLRYTIRGIAAEVLEDAYRLGIESAVAQLAAYGVGASPLQFALVRSSQVLAAATANVERQIAVILAMVGVDSDWELIIGDGDRLGILQAGPVVQDLAYWIAALSMEGFQDELGSISDTDRKTFMKQAVAALDHKTTDCCLRVHGQSQPLEVPFHLTGFPRYADDLDAPPFHWWCRTAFALYRSDFDFGLTDKMRNSAYRIMRERAQGRTGYRHPASAFS